MITKDNLVALLNHFEFTKKGNVYKRVYQQGASIEVNFETQEIKYAPIDENFSVKDKDNVIYPSKENPSRGL